MSSIERVCQDAIGLLVGYFIAKGAVHVALHGLEDDVDKVVFISIGHVEMRDMVPIRLMVRQHNNSLAQLCQPYWLCLFGEIPSGAAGYKLLKHVWYKL